MHTPKLFRNFLRCGLTGWCMELIFTALHALRRRDYTLKGTTSLWMFPIYGGAAFLAPLCRLLHQKNLPTRGLTYTGIIFLAEYISGTLLTAKNLCPWDYSRSKWNVRGMIRLDYAPLWFLAGLLLEQGILHNEKTGPSSS